jgi:oligoribonuclease NrnB/cAMP/cGMP phosphodiesterase (DHH superfamily)
MTGARPRASGRAKRHGAIGPIVVLYHAHCYDGFGAAWALHKLFGDEASYIPCAYGNPIPQPAFHALDIVIADFSWPRAELVNLASDPNVLVTVIDHHKTAEKDLRDIDRPDAGGCSTLVAVFDMEKSGARLAWEWAFPGEPVPELLLYVEDRDLWRFALPMSREINAALRGVPFDFAAWDRIDLKQLAQDGIAILRHQAEMVDVMCKQAVWRELAGYRVPVVNATVYFSEVGERLCQLHAEAPFAAYYLDRADGKRQWGMRGRKGGVDVSAVARTFGGGGHADAAGFVTRVDAPLPLAEAGR